MIKTVELVLGTTVLNFVFAAIAGAQELPVPGNAAAASLPAHTSAWPWIAVAGLVVTLGALALVSRRRMPFGKSG
jgi:hypothetical protein